MSELRSTNVSKFFTRVLKTVRFSEDFVYFCLKSYLNSWIQFIFLPCWTIGRSQFESFLYETRINIIGSFENFNIQTSKLGNIHGAFSSCLFNTSNFYLKIELLDFANF